MIKREDVDEAWAKFQKTSVKGMLDTMAAQLNEITTNTERTAQMVPKVMGDEGAINGQPDPSAMMGGGMPPMGQDPSAMMGGEGGMDQMGEGGAPPTELGGQMPPGGSPEVGGELGSGGDDIDQLLAGYSPGGDESMAKNESGPDEEPPIEDEIPEEEGEGAPMEGELPGEEAPVPEEGEPEGPAPEGRGTLLDMELNGEDVGMPEEPEEGGEPEMSGELGMPEEPEDLGGGEFSPGTGEAPAEEESMDVGGGEEEIGSAKEMTGAPSADVEDSEVNAAYSNLIDKLKSSVVSAIDAKDYGSIANITDTMSALDDAWNSSVQPSLDNIAKAKSVQMKREEDIAKSVADTNAISPDADPVTATAGGAPVDKNDELMPEDDSAPVEANAPETAGADMPPADADADASPMIKSFAEVMRDTNISGDIEIPRYNAKSFEKDHEFSGMRDMMETAIAKKKKRKNIENLPEITIDRNTQTLRTKEDDDYVFPEDRKKKSTTEKEVNAHNKEHAIGTEGLDLYTHRDDEGKLKIEGVPHGTPSSQIDEVLGTTTEPAKKSKHIATLEEARQIQKSEGDASPDRVATTNADLNRPSLDSINKAMVRNKPVVKMGVGVDPHKVVENDWAEYKAFMKSRGI